MDDSLSNQYRSEEPKNGSTLSHSATHLDTEATGIMVPHRPDGAESREKRGRGVTGSGKEEEDNVSSDSSSSEEEVDEHRLLSASFHAKAASMVGAAAGGGKSTGIAAAQSVGGRNIIK
jgi:hypothetical protein